MSRDESCLGFASVVSPNLSIMAQESKQSASEPEDVIDTTAEFKPSRVIVFPVDSSPNSKEAARWALKTLINKETDQVVLINVRPALELGAGFHLFTSKVCLSTKVIGLRCRANQKDGRRFKESRPRVANGNRKRLSG